MNTSTDLGGTFTFTGTSITVRRMGYGAMQLAGPHVFGPPRDPDAAVAVLRAAVDSGINHIDTSDFYGPHITNRLIRQALKPYAGDLTLVTKVGARRGADGSWIPDTSPEHLRQSVEDNLRNLGVDALAIVNLRVGDVSAPNDASIAAPLSVLVQMQQQGKIRHLGLSNVSRKQFAEAGSLARIVCVQNHYNLAHRPDEGFLDDLNAAGVAYVPYFPLGGFTPLQSSLLDDAAAALHASPMAVALAWLLQRSRNILLIPGTSSLAHLRENISAASLRLPADIMAKLDAMGSAPTA